MFAKVKYLLAIGFLFLIPACATGQATGTSTVDIDATVEARLAIIPTPTPQIITQEVEVIKEVIVEKEVPIETEVIKEVIVEKEVIIEVPKEVEVVKEIEVIKEVVVEVPVEKIVEKTVVQQVEVVKEVQVVVTATPTPMPTAIPTATPMPTPTPTVVPPTPTPIPTPTVVPPTPTGVPPIPIPTPTGTPTPTPLPGTQVGGMMSSDTTWTSADSPYLITDTIQIPEGIILEITEGVTINTKGGIGNSFLVHGTIIAEGTSANRITFNANGNNLFNGKNSQLEYALVQLNYCNLRNGLSIIPYLTRGGLKISNCIINDMTGPSDISHPLQAYGSPPHPEVLISKNVFNNSAGFTVSAALKTLIQNNKFVSKWNVDGYWIEVYGGGPIVEHNSFLDEGTALAISSTAKYTLMSATNNYWGTVDPEKIADKILDYKDDILRGGPIGYQPFLTEPHPDTP